MDASQIFKALSDPTRLRCLSLLNFAEELCVCELTHALSLAQPKISHHLAALRNVGLVTDRKAGLWTFYRISPNVSRWVIDVINTTLEGIKNEEPYMTDLATLKEIQNRPNSICSN